MPTCCCRCRRSPRPRARSSIAKVARSDSTASSSRWPRRDRRGKCCACWERCSECPASISRRSTTSAHGRFRRNRRSRLRSAIAGTLRLLCRRGRRRRRARGRRADLFFRCHRASCAVAAVDRRRARTPRADAPQPVREPGARRGRAGESEAGARRGRIVGGRRCARAAGRGRRVGRASVDLPSRRHDGCGHRGARVMDALMTSGQHLLGAAWLPVWTLVKILCLVVPLIIAVAYLTFVERKVIGYMQVRIGPNRVGPLGLLQPFADVFKLIFKEVIIPTGANRYLFFIAPVLSIAPAVAAWAVIPLTGNLVFADVNAGLLYLLAMTSIGAYGVILAGWASNSKYAFIGAMRSAAQIVSYEIAMGFALVGVLMAANSLNLKDI